MLSNSNNPITDPMRHAVLNGGKRLRAFLAVESGALYDVDRAQALRTAAAIECMHAYSLVHDDLPCMDDDDLRRGKPTVHIKWDEATAVLAGDALQTLAFEILADIKTSPNAEVRVSLIQSLAQASGAFGMVLGQMLDIAAETAPEPLKLDEITHLQAKKTGALIQWSAHSGAILAQDAGQELLDYSKAVGLAFQIQDDVLDVLGDAKVAGKRLQKDAEAGKATFVSLLGLEQSQKKATSLVENACDALGRFGDKATALRQVAHYIVNRDL
ncbi:MAG: polyprenyl synthetase family protein [Amylibacter sp.]